MKTSKRMWEISARIPVLMILFSACGNGLREEGRNDKLPSTSIPAIAATPTMTATISTATSIPVYPRINR